MKNNEYIKYNNTISPDDMLIENTRNLMLKELDRQENVHNTFWISSRKYIAAVACFVFIGTTLLVVPKLQKVPIGNKQPENTSILTQVTTGQTESSYTELSSATTVCLTAQNNVVTMMPQVSDTTVNSSEVSQTNAVVIENINTSQVTTHSFQYTGPVTTAPPANTESAKNTECTESQITTQVTVPSESIYTNTEATVTTNLKPGNPTGTTTCLTSETTTTPVTTQQHFYTENISGVGEVAINLSYNYEFDLFSGISVIKQEDVQNYFDPTLNNLCKISSDVTIMSEKYDLDFEKGMCCIFGEKTGLDDVYGKFVFASLSKNNLLVGYRVNNALPVFTKSGDRDFCITKITQYDDVYICSYEYDSIYYSLMFKGYNISEIFEILLS